jgi:hypothetical protein
MMGSQAGINYLGIYPLKRQGLQDLWEDKEDEEDLRILDFKNYLQ